LVRVLDYNLKFEDLLPEEKSRETLDLEALSDGLSLSGINLSDGAGRVLSREDGSSTLVLGGELLAVATIERKAIRVSQMILFISHSSEQAGLF